MTVTLELRPEVEERIIAEAKAQGMSVEDYIQQQLEDKAITPKPQELTTEEWLRLWNQWLSSHDYIKAPPFPMRRSAARASTAGAKISNCEVARR